MSQRLTLYLLSTDNIHIVLENDNTVLIKGLKKVVTSKFSRNTHLIETSYDRLKSREITFLSNTGCTIQEFSDGLQISMNIKDITIPLIIHYYLLSIFRTLHTNLSTLNHNVRLLPSQYQVGTMQYVRVKLL